MLSRIILPRIRAFSSLMDALVFWSDGYKEGAAIHWFLFKFRFLWGRFPTNEDIEKGLRK